MPTFAKQIEGPVAVIGDVHGQVRQLDDVLRQLQGLPDYQDRWIVFIGDLVDRGEDSSGAVQRVLDLMRSHPKTTCVSGNHELAMGLACGVISGADRGDWPERWTDHYGSEETFASYGAAFPDCDDLHAKLPEEHRALLRDLPWAVEHPEFYFVHAGLDPNMNFETQRRILDARDFTLNRPPWLCSKSFAKPDVPADCGLTVVSGHVPVDGVKNYPQRMLIDTTGGLGGSLSCVLLPERSLVASRSVGGPPVEAAAPAASFEAEDPRRWYEFWK